MSATGADRTPPPPPPPPPPPAERRAEERREVGPILALAVAGGAGLGIERIGAAVAGGATRALDERILLALRDPADPSNPLGPHWLEEAVRDVTGLGGVAVLGLLVVAAAVHFALVGRRAEAVAVLATGVGAVLLGVLLKEFYGRPRPDLVPELVRSLNPSFPSGHAAGATAVYLVLGAALAREAAGRAAKLHVAALAVLLSLAVGASRVYLGVHWPSDVLAGWLLGAGWAAVVWWALRRADRDR